MTFSKQSLSVLLFTGLFAASVSLSACMGGGGPPQFPPASVDVAPVEVTTWTTSYVGSGTLEANNKVDMNVETGGSIIALFFNEGQRVSKGQTLARLKADKYAAQVNQAAAGIQTATQDAVIQDAEIQRLQAMVNSAASRRQLAENEFKRFEKLFQDQFVSGQELDQRHTNFITASADYDASVRELAAARARKKSASSGIIQARSNLRYTQALAGETVLRAPFNGRVGQKYISVGDYVAPGQKIVTVVDDSAYKVKFAVPERYLPMIHLDQSVLVSQDGHFNQEKAALDPLTQTKGHPVVTGQVVFVDPVVDPESRTVMIKALVRDPENLLRHGQSVIAKLLMDKLDGAIVIPEESIVAQGEKTLVYVVKPFKKQANQPPSAPGMPVPTDQVELQEVTIGFRDAGRVQIIAGLKPNERIVTSGLQKIYDGAPVVAAPVRDNVSSGNAAIRIPDDKTADNATEKTRE